MFVPSDAILASSPEPPLETSCNSYKYTCDKMCEIASNLLTDQSFDFEREAPTVIGRSGVAARHDWNFLF
jgi:hypothetical protein